MNCPECKAADALKYAEDYLGGEIETWHCTKCRARFLVPIEIVRDFDGAENIETMGAA